MSDDLCTICHQLPRTDTLCDGGWIEMLPLAEGYNPAQGRCRQWAAQLRATAHQQGLSSAGLSDAQYSGDWDSLELSHTAFKAARNIAQNITDVAQQGLNLIFVGPTGTGKTHAGVLVCRAAMNAGLSVIKLDWSRFLDGLRDSYSDKTIEGENKKLERVCSADLLMLDDIGAGGEDGKNFSTSRLEKIISRRYDAQRPTLLTANFTPDRLAELLGDRAASRIDGRVIRLTFNGVRYREKTERAEVAALVNRLWAGAR